MKIKGVQEIARDEEAILDDKGSQHKQGPYLEHNSWPAV